MSYYGLAPRRDENPEVILPVAASATNIAVGANWAWGAWAQVTAGEAYPLVLYGIELTTGLFIPVGVTFTQGTQVQVGIGAAAAEVPVAETCYGAWGFGATTGNVVGNTGVTLPLAPVLIPASARIAVRMVTGNAANRMYPAVYLTGYNALNYSPEYDFMVKRRERMLKGLRLQTQGSRAYPSLGYASPASGAAWVYGAWVTAIAAAANDLLLTNLHFLTLTQGLQHQVEIGIGVGGSERTVAKVGCPARPTFSAAAGTASLPRPYYVKAGERVALRTYASSAGAAVDCQLIAQELL